MLSDEQHGGGRQKRVVLAPQRLALKLPTMRECIAVVTVAIGKVHRGERAISRKPLRREGRLSPPGSVVFALFAQIFCAGAPGACGQPAFPAP